jgi:GNAT superfamily N-acetyltransferase
MTAYRFCRTDDIGLLVDALNRCWAPHFPDEPPMTPAAFKRSIRDLQVWCSSCMVAFSGSEPIGVLIGAKRPSATLVHKIAVHPDHRRQGHGRHLLASLGSKLAILGPPRIVAEVPETLAPACGLFSATGYLQEAVLTDHVLERHGHVVREPANVPQRVSHASGRVWGAGAPPPPGGVSPPSARLGRGLAEALRAETDDASPERGPSERAEADAKAPGPYDTRFVIPVTIDDLAANGLLGAAHPQACWERSIETLTARKNEIKGLAVASDERIEAYLLYIEDGEIVSLGGFVDDEGARLRQLLSCLPAGANRTFRFPKVHTAEMSDTCLQSLGFRPAVGHRLYSARARAE